MEKEIGYQKRKIILGAAFLGSLIILIVLLTLITALFIKQEFKVEKEIVINRTKQDVFDYVKLFGNQNNYCKWPAYDSSIEQESEGIDGTAGFVLRWKSKKEYPPVLKETIKKIVEGDTIEYYLGFEQPLPSDFLAYMITEPVNDSITKVKWGAKRKVNYPFNIQRVFSMNMEDSVGNYFDAGLIKLKHILEKH